MAGMAVFLRGWLPHRGKAQMACNFFSAKLLANGHDLANGHERPRIAKIRRHLHIIQALLMTCVRYV